MAPGRQLCSGPRSHNVQLKSLHTVLFKIEIEFNAWQLVSILNIFHARDRYFVSKQSFTLWWKCKPCFPWRKNLEATWHTTQTKSKLFHEVSPCRHPDMWWLTHWARISKILLVDLVPISWRFKNSECFFFPCLLSSICKTYGLL